jgi:hypothetical protein
MDVLAALTRALVVVTMCGVAAMPRAAAGQTVSGSALKAAFLYNFVKFVEWPAAAADSEPLVMCVTGDSGVATALDDMVRGRTVDGRRVVVRRVRIDVSARACQLLYVSGLDGAAAATLIGQISGSAVLTASDMENFARLGGVAEFFVDADRMRFAINVDSAQRAGLRVSSKLLGLAKIVRDDASGSRQ